MRPSLAIRILLRSAVGFLPALSFAAAAHGAPPAGDEAGPGAGPAPAHRLPSPRRQNGTVVRASGTVEPEEVTDVSAQVVGVVASFGPDPRGEKDPAFRGKGIDYNSPVEKGTVLAQLDDGVYRAEVEKERANYTRAEAELLLAKAKAAASAADVKRLEALEQKQSATAEEVATHRAELQVSEAAVKVAEAGVGQAKASLSAAEQNLAYTTIRSPVKGVVVDRRVNVGNAVTNPVNAPSLFLIADLDRLQVWATVNEVDIGRVRPGQPVRFTVPTFPDATFTGRLEKIRLNPTLSPRGDPAGALTFTVEISVQRGAGDKQLLPYLTADVEIETAGGDDKVGK